MTAGKVKWFNNAKGYGFVLPDGGGEDLFAHYTAIKMDGYKTLKAGQSVTFDIIQGPKGLHAVNIQELPEESPEELSDTENAEDDSGSDVAVEVEESSPPQDTSV